MSARWLSICGKLELELGVVFVCNLIACNSNIGFGNAAIPVVWLCDVERGTYRYIIIIAIITKKILYNSCYNTIMAIIILYRL